MRNILQLLWYNNNEFKVIKDLQHYHNTYKIIYKTWKLCMYTDIHKIQEFILKVYYIDQTEFCTALENLHN